METIIENLLTITDAATYLSLTRVTIYSWLASGRLTAVVIGGTKYIPREELDAILAERGERRGSCP
jgi:excisionase family DNA binding protein